jgi:hypothetical protein
MINEHCGNDGGGIYRFKGDMWIRGKNGLVFECREAEIQ